MAIEITTTDLGELKVLAENLLKKWSEAETVEAQREIDKDLEDVVAKYAEISKSQCYKAAKDSGDPMEYAVREFYFPTIRVKETKDTDTGVTTREIQDVAKPIDLGDLHKRLEGIGADKMWFYAAEKLNYYLTVRAAQRMGADTFAKLLAKNDSMTMNQLSRDFNLGKNPVSNTNLLKTLQQVVTMMLGGEYKVTSHDVNYLVDVYSNDNKKSKTGITAANHKTLRNYLKKVCYRVLTDGTGYDVEQKEVKVKG